MNTKFKIKSEYTLIKAQENAVNALSNNILNNKQDQILLGVTGSGKTFVIAHVISKLQMPTLIISHNKTLAGQLYQEMKDFFPNDIVSYFVSYYDYYQPEAYIPQTDTYIEKEATINQVIDRLRLEATSSIIHKDNVIIIASVSCIYNIGSPQEYLKSVFFIEKNLLISQKEIISNLVKLQYIRDEFSFLRGTFRIRSHFIDIYPPDKQDYALRIYLKEDKITNLEIIHPVTGKIYESVLNYYLFPAKLYLVDHDKFKSLEKNIRSDLEKESQELKFKNKIFEAERLIKKVNYDLEMIKEVGYVNGIENYSRYFDNRKSGDPPYSLIDFFNYRYKNKWLMIIDESHMTIPQIRGMYNGDRSRKQTLIDYGFRLKAALDNRPLRFNEFLSNKPTTIYLSATPDQWELNYSNHQIVELLVRPTGILDPKIIIKKVDHEIDDLCNEIKKRVKRNEKILVTVLTKQNAEDLSFFLKENSIRTQYLHSDIKTLVRTDILTKLRKSEFDVLIGVNLLREGLDLPEVSLVAILDADKTGFLRSKTSLIQTMGRAARHTNGTVLLYLKHKTEAIKHAISEVNRRRNLQVKYNKQFNITPYSIKKSIKENIANFNNDQDNKSFTVLENKIKSINIQDYTIHDKKLLILNLQKELKSYVKSMNFEAAIIIRDKLIELES